MTPSDAPSRDVRWGLRCRRRFAWIGATMRTLGTFRCRARSFAERGDFVDAHAGLEGDLVLRDDRAGVMPTTLTLRSKSLKVCSRMAACSRSLRRAVRRGMAPDRRGASAAAVRSPRSFAPGGSPGRAFDRQDVGDRFVLGRHVETGVLDRDAGSFLVFLVGYDSNRVEIFVNLGCFDRIGILSTARSRRAPRGQRKSSARSRLIDGVRACRAGGSRRRGRCRRK